MADAEFFDDLARCGNFVFGKIKTTSDQNHAVAVETEKPAFFCSCTVRQRPCFHALALAFLFEKLGADFFSENENLPDWVENLVSGSAAFSKPNRKTTDAERKIEKEKRLFTRLENAAAGFDDFEIWLTDTIQHGLADSLADDPTFFETAATRLADAGMTGISREIRLLTAEISKNQNWQELAAGKIAEWYLVLRAFRRRENLPEPLLFDLQAKIGINLKKEEVVAAGEKVVDSWAVFSSKIESVEEKLFGRRTWLCAANSNRMAFLQEFNFGSRDFPIGFRAGDILKGTLVFYPSAFPLRVLPGEDLVVLEKKITRLPGDPDFKTFTKKFAEAIGQLPWLNGFPAAFESVIPYNIGVDFFIADADGRSLPLFLPEESGWKLLAFSGGYPISVFGEWLGEKLAVLLVVGEGRFFDT